ncbi:DUF1801 domain-containing protein [Owenweeksia hongkongensis]|uniref:DUF1801 domain-containing protein n=1 Tax=Owenweeksia hongkongensis TaxID=253245 RepID=UPI003A94DF32
MSELKTKKNDKDPMEFIASVENEKRKADSRVVMDLMEKITGEKGTMWGPSIVGYGSYHYKYASGREGDWMITGFSPRKQSLTLYIMPGFDRYEELMGKLGKYKTGKSCLYINKLEDVDIDVLEQLVSLSVKHMKKLT